MSRYMRQDAASNWVSLSLTDEPGTVNEAFADFFGEGFELFAAGTHDWILGSGFSIPLRNMADPPSQPSLDVPTGNTLPSPDRYLSPDFYIGTLNSGGVHINAGVMNKAAYLSVEGGSSNGFEITGIGFDKVEQIWYRALTAYFEPGETFNQAYAHIIQAATDLYSADDVWQVTKALRAVEINMPRSFAGDFNTDGTVDAADYVVWRKGLGTLYSQGVYDIWRANLSGPPPEAPGAGVPEPGVGVMLVLMAVGTCGCRGRRVQPTGR
jgi:hypothetical protein